VNSRDANLPLSVRDWPVEVGFVARDERLRYKKRREDWCDDRRSGWHCTRERNHELPHVAVGLRSIVSVWDQQWYGDRNHAHPVPVAEVPRLERLSDRRYVELTGAADSRDDPF
jgi:hypothetical protein